MAKTVVMTGGGIQGAVAAATAGADHELVFLHINYDQPAARRERLAVQALARGFGAASVMGVDLPHVVQMEEQFRGGTAARSSGVDGGAVDLLKAVQRRALLPAMITAAAHCAVVVGASRIVSGLSRRIDLSHVGFGSTDGRPDGLRELLHACNIMFEVVAPQRAGLRIEAPLMDHTHAEVVKLARQLGVSLQHTWSCSMASTSSEGTARPCGRCAGCGARTAAFSEACLIDPLVENMRARAAPVEIASH